MESGVSSHAMSRVIPNAGVISHSMFQSGVSSHNGSISHTTESGVIPHPTEPGMLQLTEQVLERLLCEDPIHTHLNVEPRPFARWVTHVGNWVVGSLCWELGCGGGGG